MDKTLQKSDRTSEIIKLDNEINAALRSSVEKAIRIGELLTEQKELLPHGEFLLWVERELPFSHDTARRYIGLREHEDKIRNVRNLTEAYRIAQIEDHRIADAKVAQKIERIEQYHKTGEKPKDWDRSTEYEYQKSQREDRIEQARPQSEPEPARESTKTKAEEIIEELLLDGNNGSEFRQYTLDGLIQELHRRILAIDTVSRRHDVINKIIRNMRNLAVECDRLAVK